jgi:hypothetical protein
VTQYPYLLYINPHQLLLTLWGDCSKLQYLCGGRFNTLRGRVGEDEVCGSYTARSIGGENTSEQNEKLKKAPEKNKLKGG